jgi:DNA-binding SARP family transcriptional activator
MVSAKAPPPMDVVSMTCWRVGGMRLHGTTTALEAGSQGVLICLLGSFRVLKTGEAVPFRHRGKAAALLTGLALRHNHQASREALLDSLWPDSDPAHAGQSLSTLVYGLRRLLSDALTGEPPVVHADGGYRLNVEAGVEVDVVQFELYRGDLCAADDVRAIVERERLRALQLSLLARLADHAFALGDYPVALQHAERLLFHDPCREDAHRLVMRCQVRLGARAQALRQYLVCREILHREFGAGPEPATEELFASARLDPGSI